MAVIDQFTGKHRFLSNFYPARLDYEDVSYPTVEHAYQAAKTTDRELRLVVSNMLTPGDAKRYGQQLELRFNWERIKLSIMRTLVTKKFTDHADLRALLLATGEATLIEGNYWGDTYWGICRGRGTNHLGKILMDIRHSFRS